MDNLDKANNYLENNDFEHALPFLDLALKDYLSLETLVLRAITLQDLNYHYDAIDDLDLAIKLDPKDCENYRLRAISKSKVLDHEGAISDLKMAIDLHSIPSSRNKMYNKNVIESGNRLGYSGMLAMQLFNEETILEVIVSKIKIIYRAKNTDEKNRLQNNLDFEIESDLNKNKLRSEIMPNSYNNYLNKGHIVILFNNNQAIKIPKVLNEEKDTLAISTVKPANKKPFPLPKNVEDQLQGLNPQNQLKL